MEAYEVDIAVLLVFFTRNDRFEKVFEKVKIAKPSKLYLYQDGPRKEKKSDIKGIEGCRKILEQIDWECEIHKNYQKENVGCDPSMYNAIKWMFETEEYGIIIEDDVVVSPTFFRFCKEMLVKYKEDERIGMVCGMNHLGTNVNANTSYFFSMESPIWGWGTWKRCVDLWDEKFQVLQDKYAVDLMKHSIIDPAGLKMCQRHQKENINYFESILWEEKWVNSRLSIIPVHNMISNIGVGGEVSTHYGDNMCLLPKAKQKIMFMEIQDMKFPLVHPKCVIRDYAYEREVGKVMRPRNLRKCMRGMEKLLRIILNKVGVLR